MKSLIHITVITNNTVRRPDLKQEHGLSFWIETPYYCFLLDTGVGKTFNHNCQKLGIHPEKLDAVVFSHGHFDHTGNCPECSDHPLPIYAGEGFFAPRYSIPDQKKPGRYIGLNDQQLEYFTIHCERLETVTDDTIIFPGIHLFGRVEMTNNFETLNPRFCLDQAGTVPDTFMDEVAVAIETQNGLVILSGCSHRGIINTVHHICDRLNTDRIEAVIGGMHMVQAEEERIQKTLSAFSDLKAHQLIPLHCTGDDFISRLKNRFPTLFIHAGAGTTLTFEMPATP